VWVAEDANMRMSRIPANMPASSLQITHNTAGRMGGGIFTQDHGNYEDPLVTTPAFPAAGPATHFQNLTLNADTWFAGNTALFVAIPPVNVTFPSDPLITLYNIQWDTNSLSPTSAPGNEHPLNNLDINFMNDIFEFIKTDNVAHPYHANARRLPSAVFQLYWRADSNAAWTLYGSHAISDADGIVTLSLSFSTTGQYRLVEVIPPPGFTPIFGYWILEITTSNNVTSVTAVHSHSGNPLFRQHDYDGDEWWWVGNKPEFELPFTGGTGISILFVSAGTLLLAATAIVIAAIKLRRNGGRNVGFVTNDGLARLTQTRRLQL